MFDLGTVFALNLLLAVLSIPFLWNLVPRNRFYGFRVPATLRDDQVWYTMNRRVARAMIPVCSVLALAAAVFERVGLDTPFGRTVLSVITLTALGHHIQGLERGQSSGKVQAIGQTVLMSSGSSGGLTNRHVPVLGACCCDARLLAWVLQRRLVVPDGAAMA